VSIEVEASTKNVNAVRGLNKMPALRVSNVSTEILNYAFRSFIVSSPKVYKEFYYGRTGMFFPDRGDVRLGSIKNLTTWVIKFYDLVIFGSGGPYVVGYAYQHRLVNDSNVYCQTVTSKNKMYVSDSWELIYAQPTVWIWVGLYIFTTIIVFIYSIVCPYNDKRPICVYFYCCGSLKSKTGTGKF
jgi:hypothetical protein